MMSILEYAIDVNKTNEDIFALCDSLNINYENEDTMLSDDDITLLDNEIQNGEIESVETNTDEDIYDDELDLKVEQIVSDANIDIDTPVIKEKLKSKVDIQSAKKDSFAKDRKAIYKNKEKLTSHDSVVQEDVVFYKEGMSVSDLAAALEVNTTEIIKKLMGLGIMANQNQSLALDVVELLVVDYNKTVKNEESADIANFENFEIIDNEDDLTERPPVVTIMGHVDHGKTSLLDAIRESDVVKGEAGGITQNIGAYQVECSGKKITFIDTPGHEAFTNMRSRGAAVTDIVIIIVAADDGVMPQTKEAIDHAKAAEVPIIVAINKIDKPGANIEKVLTELAEYNLAPESWGGDTIVCNISALTKQGLPELLENILLVAEMKELKANPNRYASGIVLESRMDKQVGITASIIVQTGTLRLGDPVVVGTSSGRVRTLKNDKFENIVEALPSTPVEITGLTIMPDAGDKFMAFETEKEAKTIGLERQTRAKEQDTNRTGMTLEELFGQIKQGVKEVNVIVKANVNGSAEAVKQSLEKIDVDGVAIRIIRSSVGAITESDVTLAGASNAIIIGFSVRADVKTIELAKERGVEIRTYDIIYKVIEDMTAAMKGMLEPEFEEKILGNIEIRQLFHFSKVGTIAGCHVLSGSSRSNSLARVIRDGIVVYTGKIKTLQREKDQVKEVKKDMDCGLTLENFQDYQEKDIVEIYELVEVKR